MTAIKERARRVRNAHGRESCAVWRQPNRTQDQPPTQQDLECGARHRVPLIVTSPRRTHSSGQGSCLWRRCLHDVTTTYHARKAGRRGRGRAHRRSAGAGGHAGDTTPSRSWLRFAHSSTGRCCSREHFRPGVTSPLHEHWAPIVADLGTALFGDPGVPRDEPVQEADYREPRLDIVYTSVVSGVPATLQASLAAGGVGRTRSYAARVDFVPKSSPSPPASRARNRGAISGQPVREWE